MLDAALHVLGWIGAAQAALLGAALLARRAAAAPDRWLGAGLVAAALACTLISLSGRGPASYLLEAAEVAATLAAGPLVAGWIARLVGYTPPRWLAPVAFAPAALWTVAALAGARFAGDPLAIRAAVPMLMFWSAAAFALAWTRRARLGARARRAVTLGLAGVLLVHLAQLARLAAPEVTSPHLVSATIGLLLVAVSFQAFRQARPAIALGAADAARDGAAPELIAEFERVMSAERAYVEPGLTVGAVARRLGVSAGALSQALNRHAGTTFSDRLAQLRTDEARRLLADPALDHLAVEAIGSRAGFGSRSAYFAEFRKRAGRAPAEFRAARESAAGAPPAALPPQSRASRASETS